MLALVKGKFLNKETIFMHFLYQATQTTILKSEKFLKTKDFTKKISFFVRKHTSCDLKVTIQF